MLGIALASNMSRDQEESHDLKGSRTIPMAKSTTCLPKKPSKPKTLYWVYSSLAHILQQFYLIREHLIPLYH
jgi:hypothetical protein